MQYKISSFSPTLQFTLFLWGWAIPAAYFWSVVKKIDVVLPHLPYFLWILPGKLWQLVPIVFVVLLLIFPIGCCYICKNKNKLLTNIFMVLFILVAIINLLWGTIVYHAIK